MEYLVRWVDASLGLFLEVLPFFAFLAAAPMVNPASFVMTAGVLGYGMAAGRLAGAVLHVEVVAR